MKITHIKRDNVMFRLWAKIFENNKLKHDMVVENDSSELNRTRKVFAAIDDVCVKFDLSRPIWLDSNIEEFKRYDKTRFTKDSFIERVDFDYLEVHVIEED